MPGPSVDQLAVSLAQQGLSSLRGPFLHLGKPLLAVCSIVSLEGLSSALRAASEHSMEMARELLVGGSSCAAGSGACLFKSETDSCSSACRFEKLRRFDATSGSSGTSTDGLASTRTSDSTRPSNEEELSNTGVGTPATNMRTDKKPIWNGSMH